MIWPWDVAIAFIHWIWHGHVPYWRPCKYNGWDWDTYCGRCHPNGEPGSRHRTSK